MASYKVEICGVNTAKLPILKEEEKDALFARIKQGDTAARETYIKGNLRLVLSVIKRFSGNHENVDDLFQIGCIGLIKSIDNFVPCATLPTRQSTPKKYSQRRKTKSRLSTKLPPNPAFLKRTSFSPSMPSRVLSVFMTRSTPMAVTHSMSWTRSVTRKTGKKTGLKSCP